MIVTLAVVAYLVIVLFVLALVRCGTLADEDEARWMREADRHRRTPR